ncbi:MAG TPA: DNA-directed RNA polymerase subunit alpha [Candidatus Paceibacterota bacterium]|nr:DNA-directed RNA polymerase subunit alpha [Candidatus Paceibacterota bacterium]HMP18752.1 DNA-directed RNA polymerase subunit alpha [Candidatus Paceibacterota bacterium]HMP85313.1 DNA-directed RNA polymerase subunit alpha [Candidatus Paceibacterota bacterium]
MIDHNIALPSKPKIVMEEGFKGVYEIDGLYPGYGHTLGNSLRRIILSSLPGAAIVELKVKGVGHEFATIEGVKEDLISIILNIKKIRLSLEGNESQTITIKAVGPKNITAKDIVAPSQVSIKNPEQHIFSLTEKGKTVEMELKVQNGLGYVPKDQIKKDRVEVGTITLDGIFTPIRRVNYETENMRVGDRTDFNRLRIMIETDGTITPKSALEKSIEIMITQLKSVVGFKEEVETKVLQQEDSNKNSKSEKEDGDMEDFLKTRVENLNLSSRTINALSAANIRTVGGLARKKEEDILEIDGMGEKGLQEIKKVLGEHGLILK